MRFLSFPQWSLNEREESFETLIGPMKRLALAAAEHLGGPSYVENVKRARVEISSDMHFTVRPQPSGLSFVVDADEDEEFFYVHPDNSATCKIENPLYWEKRGKNTGKNFNF
jgi:hypothetical protein